MKARRLAAREVEKAHAILVAASQAVDPARPDDIVTRLARWYAARGLASYLGVHQRLYRETSGLLVFARTVTAERGLGKQFRGHTVIRRYLAIISGKVASQRIATRLVRDRGDGRRGSTSLPGVGKEAITRVEVVERLHHYTVLACRLETGRTHQIRIHLAELGQPVCGEKVYTRDVRGNVFADRSEAPRLALHAAELGFMHPVTAAALHWTMPLPPDLDEFVRRLRETPGAR